MTEPRKATCGKPVPETEGKVCGRLPAHKGEHRLTLTRSSANKRACAWTATSAT